MSTENAGINCSPLKTCTTGYMPATTNFRSTLKFYPDAGFPVPQEERSLYYAKSPICEYARIIHKYGIDNHAFCYGYDEVAGDAGPNRDVFNPTSLKLTLNALT